MNYSIFNIVTQEEVSMAGINPLYFMLGMAALGLAPFLLMMTTSYVKIIVVTSLIRNALGVQQIPPAMVMNGLAMVLSIFIMAPTVKATVDIVSNTQISTDMSGELQLADIIGLAEKASAPLEDFLKKNTDTQVLHAFVGTARQVWPQSEQASISEDNLLILVPAFTITELTKAFQIGFLLYLPFIAIDLIISNILLAMGMMMVSPMTISLPFKLLLFVTLDGWLKISQGLLLSYQ